MKLVKSVKLDDCPIITALNNEGTQVLSWITSGDLFGSIELYNIDNGELLSENPIGKHVKTYSSVSNDWRYYLVNCINVRYKKMNQPDDELSPIQLSVDIVSTKTGYPVKNIEGYIGSFDCNNNFYNMSKNKVGGNNSINKYNVDNDELTTLVFENPIENATYSIYVSGCGNYLLLVENVEKESYKRSSSGGSICTDSIPNTSRVFLYSLIQNKIIDSYENISEIKLSDTGKYYHLKKGTEIIYKYGEEPNTTSIYKFGEPNPIIENVSFDNWFYSDNMVSFCKYSLKYLDKSYNNIYLFCVSNDGRLILGFQEGCADDEGIILDLGEIN